MTRGRGLVSILLVVSLVVTGFVRQRVWGARQALVSESGSTVQLGNLNSYTLALLLGGLRGPLVMIIWPTIENAKAARDLEDVDSNIELLRLLQAEFDQVHIWNMWNKAYNISVQMASIANKYATVLDGIEYGRKVLDERPDNVSVIHTMAVIYSQKLADNVDEQERKTYAKWVRRDTLPSTQPAAGGGALRKTRHETLLDEKGFILPAMLAPKRGVLDRRLPDSPAEEWDDGSELQYLRPYNTVESGGFPGGVSPYALAYNYYKRAQVLSRTRHLQHPQLSEHMIDREPAIWLRNWAKDEWGRGREAEFRAMGKAVPYNRKTMELAMASMPLTSRPASPELLNEAIFAYRRAVQTGTEARESYVRHFLRYPDNSDAYKSELDSLSAVTALVAGDRDYLEAMAAPAEKRAALAQSARRNYQRAVDGYYLMILKYYVEDDVVAAVYPAREGQAGARYDKTSIDKLDPRQYPALDAAVRQYIKTAKRGSDMHDQDRMEFETYIERASLRLSQLSE